MPYEPLFERNDNTDSLCMEIAELVGSLSPQAPLAKSPTLHRELRIKTIHSSLLIEGNRLDKGAVTAILDGRRVLGDKHDILEVENAKRAYDLIPELDPFSLDDLLLAHRTMMEGLVPEAGRFRSGNVGVFDGENLIHTGTPAKYVPQVMKDIFGWLGSTSMHPLPASCVFHFEFEFCHPFSDGNGRTGRLWQTLMLSRWRAPLAWLLVETIIRSRQQGYYAAFGRSNANGTCTAFVEFMLEVIRDALKPYAAGGTDRDTEELRVLDYFSSNPKSTVTGLASALGISKRSAERLVAALKSDGRLVRKGSPRAGTWEVNS